MDHPCCRIRPDFYRLSPVSPLYRAKSSLMIEVPPRSGRLLRQSCNLPPYVPWVFHNRWNRESAIEAFDFSLVFAYLRIADRVAGLQVVDTSIALIFAISTVVFDFAFLYEFF